MQLYMPTRVYSEENCIRIHGKELASMGKKAMLVTGRHSASRCGALQDVTEELIKYNIEYYLFDRVEENPSIETVMEARSIAIREGVDFFIGIGGGSPMDAAKAISLMTANTNTDESILYKSEKMPYLPVVCVPTTCGTGSEVTPYAILTRHAHRTKKSISHRIYPQLALLDAKYLSSLSHTAKINTCVDALAHLLESFLNTNANNLNRIYSRQGLEIWAHFQNKLLQEALNPEDHWDMLHASMYAGMAIAHTGTSMPHGLSYPVTYELGIPHGRAVGMFLGGFVDTYPNEKEAEEAIRLLGYSNTSDFRIYLKKLLGEIEVDEYIINTSTEIMLIDSAKLKNYPSALTEERLKEMIN